MQRLGGERPRGLVWLQTRSTNALCRGPACAEQLHGHRSSGMTQGTPKRTRRMCRSLASGTWAVAVGAAWTTTPKFAHEDEMT